MTRARPSLLGARPLLAVAIGLTLPGCGRTLSTDYLDGYFPGVDGGFVVDGSPGGATSGGGTAGDGGSGGSGPGGDGGAGGTASGGDGGVITGGTGGAGGVITGGTGGAGGVITGGAGGGGGVFAGGAGGVITGGAGGGGGVFAGGAGGVAMTCGNGVIDGNEACDGATPPGVDCTTFGFDSGTLRCARDCLFDTSACERTLPSCGDGILDLPDELCDGNDLGGLDCASFGLGPGTLRCTNTCEIDTARCSRCGNGVLDAGEQCDSDQFDGRSCFSLGYPGGTLSCRGSCTIDTSTCSQCGNAVIEAGENCEPSDLAGATCQSLGLGGGRLECDPTVCLLDTRGCRAGPACGNGIVELGEQCDRDPGDRTCEDFGFAGGRLACNPTTCRYVTSGCTRPPPGDCTQDCLAQECQDLLDQCTETSGCEEVLDCLDDCREAPTVSCGLSCVGSLEALAVAVVASDCVRDCTLGCL